MTFAAVCCTMILRYSYGHANKRRDAMSEDEINSRYTEEQMLGQYFPDLFRALADELKTLETRVLTIDM